MFGNYFSKNLRSKFNSLLWGTNSSKSVSDVDSYKEMDGENGFIFSVGHTGESNQDQEYYFPEEIVALILSYVCVDDLAYNCRLVCHSWKEIVETLALRYKTERECGSRLKKGILNVGKSKPILPWKLYYWILQKDIFGRNLIKNNCGQEKFKHWEILSNGGNKFAVEQLPMGSDPLPNCDDFEGCTSCFVTSYHSNTKIQTIDLSAEGLVPELMDEYRPVIDISEWYAGRFDCGCIYELRVVLLDKNRREVDEYSERVSISQWEGRDWKQIKHTFINYRRGIRYISFYHGGMDTQNWFGHYGCKFSGGTVKLFYALPQINNTA